MQWTFTDSTCPDSVCSFRNRATGRCARVGCVHADMKGLECKTAQDNVISIELVAKYLTDDLIIPPDGTVPATREERVKEWVQVLKGLMEGKKWQ